MTIATGILKSFEIHNIPPIQQKRIDKYKAQGYAFQDVKKAGALSVVYMENETGQRVRISGTGKIKIF